MGHPDVLLDFVLKGGEKAVGEPMKVTHIKANEEGVYRAVLDGLLEIDSEGRVWRVAIRNVHCGNGTVRILPVVRRRGESKVLGYLHVTTKYEGVEIQCKAHRLVWRHFNGRPIGAGLTINHIDGDKANNHPDNLEEATYSEQQVHAVHVLKRGHAVHQYGVDNSMAKITDAQAIEIIERVGRGEIQRVVALDYGLSQGHVSAIYHGKIRAVRSVG